MTTTAEYIAGWEGYAQTAYWDVNHWRLGYGSDTEGPEQIEVTQGMTTTRARALENLAFRIPAFQSTAIKAMGADTWAKLTENQKTAITSLVYNYGRLPIIVYPSDPEKTSLAIAHLQTANGGVNRKRRIGEAQYYLTGVTVSARAPTKKPTVVATGVTGSAAIVVALWQMLSTAGPGTAWVLFGVNVVLAGIIAVLSYELLKSEVVLPHTNTPTEKSVSDVAELLQQAIDNRDAAKKALDASEQEVTVQKDALAHVITGLQTQITQAEGLQK